ncbi:MAG TPA: endolytic transglycosylase MltG [Thermodesulfobacteriota bacterium]|nr:endolytic transglycosylase MltG [Thermodesulfobacteriota bacterium]
MNRLLRHKRIFILLLLLFFLPALFIGWFLFVPPSGTSTAKVVYIKRGMPLRQIAEFLHEQGIIRNKHLFILTTTVLGKKAHLRAGEYEFESGMQPLEVLNTLVRGQGKRHRVTIPEGYTLSQIAQLLEDQKIVERKDFLQKASSPVLITSLGLSSSMIGRGVTLEGYLFPETYQLYKEMDPEEVIKTMVHQFNKVMGPALANRASPHRMSEWETVILASLIEKETPLPEEKPLVSAVFHNRLVQKMPLQSDPTVIYGIRDFNGNLTKEDLQRPTPYNTYLRTGLPPSPICNPGKDSLLAALNPAPVPYLYFVSKNDGSHHFSSEIEDHNRAVWKFQKNGRKNSLTKK